MKHTIINKTAAAILALCFLLPGFILAQSSKTRMIMMADMDNEPDELQQNVHMLMYSNMFDLEGLIACSGKYLRNRVAPEELTMLVDGYAKIFENLKKHGAGWPEPDYLHSIVKGGIPAYGIDAVGDGNSSDASELIVQALLNDDPRKIYFVGNAGTNNLAQALWDLDGARNGTLNQLKMDEISKKIIVFENGSQDNCGAWIAGNYPEVAWFRSNGQTYAWGGGGNVTNVMGPYTWEPYDENDTQGQNDWAKEHIMNNHGALGELYPERHGGDWFLEGGGTTPWMGLTVPGLVDPEHLWWGGWSGRFSRVRHQNVWSHHDDIKGEEEDYNFDFWMYEADSEQEEWTDPVHDETFNGFRVPVFRFRRPMWNGLRARMDYCVKEFNEANHRPVAVLNSDSSDTIVRMQAVPGQELAMNSSGSYDPDGDNIAVKWWIYREAGTYDNDVTVTQSREAATNLTIPNDALDKEIHLILELQDDNDIIPLYAYRRVVIDVVKEVTALNETSENQVKHSLQYRQLQGLSFLDNNSSEVIVVRILNLSGREVVTFSLESFASKTLSLSRGMYIASEAGKSGNATSVFTIH